MKLYCKKVKKKNLLPFMSYCKTTGLIDKNIHVSENKTTLELSYLNGQVVSIKSEFYKISKKRSKSKRRNPRHTGLRDHFLFINQNQSFRD